MEAASIHRRRYDLRAIAAVPQPARLGNLCLMLAALLVTAHLMERYDRTEGERDDDAHVQLLLRLRPLMQSQP